MKCSTPIDDLNYWQVNESVDDDSTKTILASYQRSITLSVNLLRKTLKNDQSKFELSSCCPKSSPSCQCKRSFHIFCTELIEKIDQDFNMIHIHPAPRHHDRNIHRSTPVRMRRKHRHHDENDQETVVTARSEPAQLTLADNQAFEKKLPIPLRMTTRTTSLNIPSTSNAILGATRSLPYQRPFPMSSKTSTGVRAVKRGKSFLQLQIRAQTVFDQSTPNSQFYPPRGPPPSPKSPNYDQSIFLPTSSSSALSISPLRSLSIAPQTKYSVDRDYSSYKGKLNYLDHAREYLSASDCSDIEEENEEQEKQDFQVKPNRSRTKFLQRNQSLSRTETVSRDRSLPQNPYLSLAEVYYSSLDIYKTINEKSRRHLRSRTRLVMPNRENDENSTTISKTTGTTKNSTAIQSKAVYGFSKTTSSTHFGHATGRLTLQSSFEKWPQPSSRRTPIERKQEVTTLRLVTLPLVTS